MEEIIALEGAAKAWMQDGQWVLEIRLPRWVISAIHKDGRALEFIDIASSVVPAGMDYMRLRQGPMDAAAPDDAGSA